MAYYKRNKYAYGGLTPQPMAIPPLAQTSTTGILPNTLQGVPAPQGGVGAAGGANPIAAGAGMVADIGGGIIDATTGGVDDLGIEKVSVGAETGKSALKGAATGAAVGSVVPVVGTAVGAVVGGVGGAVSGFLGGKKKQKEAAAQRKKIFKQAGTQQAQAYEQAQALQPQAQLAPTFAGGGYLQTPVDNPTIYQNGGTHEQNPLGGIPVGGNALVEEGEVRHKDYIFSNRLS